MIKAIEKAQTFVRKEEVAEEAPAGPTELEVLQEIKALLEKNKNVKGFRYWSLFHCLISVVVSKILKSTR